MGAFKPETQVEQVFKAPYIADGAHPVPVSNFLNAQCMLRYMRTRILRQLLMDPRLLGDLPRHATADLQGRP